MNTDLLEKVSKLSIDERIELVEAIWETIRESQNDLPLSDAQIALLEERLAALEADPSAGSPWEEVRTRLEKPR